MTHIATLANREDESFAMDLARAYTALGSGVPAERLAADKDVAVLHQRLLTVRLSNQPRAAAILSRALWHYKTNRLYAVPKP